jgi:uncharacterized Zn-binding protein involved in type VI secretion
MPVVARLGDMSTGHGTFPPRASTSASPDVRVNGIGVLRQTDTYALHCTGPVCHVGTVSVGSATVRANGLPIARIADPISCGDAIAMGSPNVRAG